LKLIAIAELIRPLTDNGSSEGENLTHWLWVKVAGRIISLHNVNTEA